MVGALVIFGGGRIVFSSFSVGKDTVRAVGLMGRGTRDTNQTLSESLLLKSCLLFLKKNATLQLLYDFFKVVKSVYIYINTSELFRPSSLSPLPPPLDLPIQLHYGYQICCPASATVNHYGNIGDILHSLIPSHAPPPPSPTLSIQCAITTCQP